MTISDYYYRYNNDGDEYEYKETYRNSMYDFRGNSYNL